jgi:hypothetical protein
VIRSIVLASQAVQAAFIEAKNAGAEDVANALRLAQFRLDDALFAAIPSNTDDGTLPTVAEKGAAA